MRAVIPVSGYTSSQSDFGGVDRRYPEDISTRLTGRPPRDEPASLYDPSSLVHVTVAYDFKHGCRIIGMFRVRRFDPRAQMSEVGVVFADLTSSSNSILCLILGYLPFLG